MWRVDRTFLFFGGLNFEQMPVQAYRICGEWIALFFFFWGGVNLEQVLGRAYRKCGEWTALFFFLGLNLFFLLFPLFPSLSLFFHFFYLFLPLFHSFSIFYFFFYLFTSFFFFFLFFFFFFAFFSHLFFLSPFSHYFPFFPFFPFFFAFFFAFSLAWPRPQPCRFTLPSLTLPHITSPLLSFLDTFFFKKKEHRDFQQISVLSKKLLPTKKADHFKVYPYVQLSTLDTNCHSKCIMSVRCVCGQSTHLNRSSFLGQVSKCNADVKSRH